MKVITNETILLLKSVHFVNQVMNKARNWLEIPLFEKIVLNYFLGVKVLVNNKQKKHSTYHDK